MDVLLDDEQILIQDTLRKFFVAQCPPALVRSAEKAATRIDSGLWDKMRGQGWLSLCLPESAGGSGLPMNYLGLLAEEAGRHLLPVPLHGHLIASDLVDRHGLSEHNADLAKLLTGERIATFAFQGSSGGWSINDIDAQIVMRDGSMRLNGHFDFVDQFQNADFCIIPCWSSKGATKQLALVVVDTKLAGIVSEALITTAKDSQSKVTFCDVDISSAAVVLEGQAAERALKRMLELAAVLTSCQLAGSARRAAEFAIEYAKGRVAFGQPIGSFQAIQHMCADMIIAVDGCDLLNREALWRIGQDLPASVEVAQAKAFSSEKCVAVCRAAQQIHGGIGFMMEFDLQLWYRRVVSWSLRHGTAREHRRTVAAALLDTPHRVRLDRPLEMPNKCAGIGDGVAA